MIYSIVNQKGGVGKTTTAINISAYLARYGKKVLLVDLDPQSNATSGLGFKKDAVEGIYEALIDKVPITELIYDTERENFRVIPSSQDLSAANIELVNLDRREFILKEKIKIIKKYFEYIIIDCPPSLGLLTINALTASDKVIIPVQCEYFALEGLSQLLHTINLVKENLNEKLIIEGALLTMYDQRVVLSEQIAKELHHFFPNKVFQACIPRNIRLTEAPSHGKTILEYDHWSKGARSYRKLVHEIIRKNEKATTKNVA